jgi:hypothetical protein
MVLIEPTGPVRCQGDPYVREVRDAILSLKAPLPKGH